MGRIEWIGIALAVGVVLLLAIYYAVWAARTRQRTGRWGLAQETRLSCPRCRRAFDYRWVPGASLSSFRLGTRRLLRCPLCGAWSVFDVRSSRPPADPAKGP